MFNRSEIKKYIPIVSDNNRYFDRHAIFSNSLKKLYLFLLSNSKNKNLKKNYYKSSYRMDIFYEQNVEYKEGKKGTTSLYYFTWKFHTTIFNREK